MSRPNLTSVIRFIVQFPLDRLAAFCPREKREKSLLLVHLHHIGDYVLLRNFVALLKSENRFQDHRVTLCANADIRELVETFDRDIFDDYIWVDRNRFLGDLCYRLRLLRRLASAGFSVAIQPAYSREFYFGDAIIRASGATRRIGSSGITSNIPPWQKRISDRYYTDVLQMRPEIRFEFLRNKEFFEALIGKDLSLRRPVIDAGSVPLPQRIGRPYAVIFPGASVTAKCWPAERFAVVARHLNEHYALTVLLAGGAGDRSRADRFVAAAADCDVIDMVGKTTLPQLAGYLQQARLLVANDTVAVHLAVAVGTPVAYMLTGAHFGRFGPYPANVFHLARALFPDGVDHDEELDITAKRLSMGPKLDISTISVEKVIVAVDELLALEHKGKDGETHGVL